MNTEPHKNFKLHVAGLNFFFVLLWSGAMHMFATNLKVNRLPSLEVDFLDFRVLEGGGGGGGG